MPNLLISLFTIFNGFLAYTAYNKIKNSKKNIEFIYSWAFLYGAFVWEDLFVFSLYFFTVSLMTVFTRDLKIWVLCFIIFWIVRSTGETLYFFLQQFIQPKHFPHNLTTHFTIHQLLFGKISHQKSFILMQVFFQIVLITSFILFALLLLNWHTITWKF